MKSHLFQEIIEARKKDFKEKYKKDFSDSEFPTPKLTPNHLLKDVSTIKVLEAEARQIGIMMEVQRFNKSGDVFVVPDESVQLIEEFNKLKEVVTLWSASE